MKRVFFENANIVDVINRQIIYGGIYVEDGIICSLGADAKCPDGTERIDMGGKTVLPGLFNVHAHITSPDSGMDDPRYLPSSMTSQPGIMLLAIKHCEENIQSGVTFIRDVGGLFEVDIEAMHAVNKGAIVGPDMLVSGRAIVITGGHGWTIPGMTYEVNCADEARRAARLNIRAGATALKVCGTGGVASPGDQPGSAQLTVEEMHAVCEEGHRAGLIVASHAQGTQGIKNSILAGVDSIEHGFYLDDECIELMLEHNVWYVPTLVTVRMILERGPGKIPEFMIEKCKYAYEAHLKSFEKARAAGVKIASGTDASAPCCPHYESTMEAVDMVMAGMSPWEALYAITMESAKLCRVDKLLGSIEKGKKAHFSVFEKNPAEDIKEISKNVMTIKNGEIVWKK